MRQAANQNRSFGTVALLAAIVFVGTFTGCLKDTHEFVPHQENVLISAHGVVLDEQDLPVNMTTVETGGGMTSTDPNGVFIFSNVVVPANQTNITFKKEGYFDNHKAIQPSESIPSLTVRLQSLGQDYFVSGAAGGNVSSPSDVNMIVYPSTILQNGQPYNGQMKVNISYLNPLLPNLYTKLPGEALAVDENGVKGLLRHYGTVFFQFRDEQNEPLQADAGRGFEIKIPIPSELSADAPDELDFWKLDVATNTWQRQGISQRNGGYYTAIVFEEGIYSVQDIVEYVSLQGQILDTDGKEMPNALISLSREGHLLNNKLWTDENGGFTTFVPLREDLTLHVEDECYESITELNIGPFISKTDLGEIEVDPGENYWEISGQLLKCSAIPEGVTEGYSIIQTATHYWIIPVDQGFFRLNLFICSRSIQVRGMDIENQLEADGVPITIVDKPRVFNTGVIKACQ